MRQIVLLPLDGMHVTAAGAKNSCLLGREAHELNQLLPEDTGDEVVPMVGRLPSKELFSDLLPLGVTGKHNEEVWWTVVADILHRILGFLMHVSRTAGEGGW